MVAGGDHLLRAFSVWLFHKAVHLVHRRGQFRRIHFDIAIAGFGTGRTDPIGGEPAAFDERQKRCRCGVKGGGVEDDMVAGHDQ